jgi:hypothetical protein
MATRFDIGATDYFFKAIDTAAEINVVDSAGAAQALTGLALKWVLKRDAKAAAALITKTTGGGAITLDDEDGTDDQAVIAIAKADTSGLRAGTYYQELYRTDSGSETLLSFGDCVLRERVSV